MNPQHSYVLYGIGTFCVIIRTVWAVFQIWIRIHVDPYWNGSPGSGSIMGIRIRIQIQDSQNGVKKSKRNPRFQNNYLFKFFVWKTLDPDPYWHKMLYPDLYWNKEDSETLHNGINSGAVMRLVDANKFGQDARIAKIYYKRTVEA